MKNHVLKRLLTAGLILDLLLPCVMTMPASAAQREEDPGTILYEKTAEDLSSQTKIDNFWSPNTKDSVNVAPDRRDIGLVGRITLKGAQMDGTSFRVVRITNETVYTADGAFDYGLPLKEDGTSDALALTLKKGSDGNTLSLDTSDYGEMELTFRYVRGEHYRHVAFIDDFQVYVSTDGGNTWSEDYAGIKSHRTVAVGTLSNGNPLQCHEVKSEDLTALVKDGEVINAIMIRPFGDYTHPSYGTYATFVRAIEITGYETKAPGEDIEYITVPENILRQIVVKHAERLMAVKWTSDTTIKTANGSSTITYSAGTQYKGPAYSRNIGSTYELFASGVDAQGNYIGGKTDETIYGMDCLTVVNECISQITSSKSAHSWYYMFYDLYDQEKNPDGKLIPLYTLTEADGIERYTMDDIFDQEFNSGEMRGYYDRLEAGDLVMSSGHAMLVSRGHEGTSTTLGISETAGAIKDNSSLRIDRDEWYSSLYYGSYYPMTLTEYADGKVEKEHVTIATNDPADFVAAGFYADLASNYTIRKYTLTLTDKDSGEELYTSVKCGINSDFNVCFTDAGLNEALKELEENPGKYELKVDVLSGPRIYLANGDVIDDVADAANTVNPTTTFTYNIVVEGEEVPAGPARATACTEGHTGWQSIDQSYLDSKLNSSEARYVLDESLTYCLTEDVELDYPVYFGKVGTGTICLNGHDITSSTITKGANDDGVITLAANNTLDICNCNAEQGGSITVTATVSDADHNFSVLRVEAPDGEDKSSVINLFENVTLANCTAKLVSVPNHEGAVIHLVGGEILGGLTLESGVFHMYRGTIGGNTTGVGVTVSAGATLIMEGGTISGNAQGVNNAGTFTMSGGVISGNSGTKQGAGVYNSGTFTMSGNAVIKANTTSAKRAGGVYNSGTFTMNGGTIGGKGQDDGNKCTGSIAGGGVYTAGPFTMNAGSIVGNSALRGGGVAVVAGTFTMNGGIITQNSISKSAAGSGVLVGYSSATTSGTVVVKNGTISGNATSAGTLYDVSVWVGSYTQSGDDTKVDSVYAYSYVANTPVNIKFDGGTTKTLANRNTTSVIGKDITISGGTFGISTENIMEYLANVPVRLQATNKNGWANETTVTKGFARTSEVFDFTGSLDLALSLQCDNDFVTDNPNYDYRYSVSTDAATAELTEENGVLTLKTTGITAKEMGDKIEFKVMSEDGSEVFYEEELSVYDFAKAQHAATKVANYKTLLEDMINYGNAAAAKFSDGASMNALGDGTVELKGDWVHSDNYGAPVEDLVAATLSLKDKVELNVYFNGVASNVTDGEKNYTVSAANSAADITYVKLDDIALADAMKPVELAFELDGQEYTVTYSIKDYVIDALADETNDQWSLMDALQKFIDSVCTMVTK